MTGPDVCDVVVVGAGLAGLAAAAKLQDRGHRVLVLEARDRVGGRTLNEPIDDEHIVEVGGQWIGPTQHRVLDLVAELGLDLHATHQHGDTLVEFRGRSKRYRGRIPALPPHVLADVAQAQLRLDRMARKVPLAAPWTAPRAAEWDSQTLDTWLRGHVRTQGGRDVCALVCQAVFAAEPADLSLLHFLFYLHSGGGIDQLTSTTGGAQHWRVVGGTQRIAQEMARRLGADIVELSNPVRRIETTDLDVTVVADRRTVRARAVIVAIPPTLTARISYDPPLPGHRDQLAQRFVQGSVVKCMAVYPDPFWRRDGLNGQATSDVGPVKLCYDNSPPDAAKGVLLGFLEANHARRLGQLPLAERRAEVLGCFARHFGPRAAEPLRYLEKDWSQEEWTRGCYGGYLPPGGWTAYRDTLRAPIGRIHWAGAESATVWNGYMDGALTSGERAATEVLTVLDAGSPRLIPG
ncbi:flavin monoamine oxidase family protein [Nocardia asteroides]|uniref:flavin monoamine oxidase family protein n=1 Tax=Nocardia asteroides TaxID=1824 RepID=UPI001E6246E5|nr:flavin monoamine oxidase family protein [Nocardia asteroides]UGT56471.1 flavin monoamine oxidase family protein [Nocardia asteroides]